jgi:hypothetical protein
MIIVTKNKKSFISVTHLKVVLYGYVCHLSRGWAHTYLRRMYMWCATGMHIMRGVPQMHAPRIWGPDTLSPGARWDPLIHGAYFPRCATGKMISVEHLYVVRHEYLSMEHRNLVLHR